jgi:DNA mismatch endonuclease (patch repair protein)
MKKPYASSDAPQPFQDGSGFYTTAKRSKTMARIRGKHTRPERALRQALWKMGYRYRLHAKQLPGHPDIAFPQYRLAIFVDGEFWHGFQWEQKKEQIKSNREYWIPKIERNMARDLRNTHLLECAGWIVLRFWSKEVEKNMPSCIEKILWHLGRNEE